MSSLWATSLSLAGIALAVTSLAAQSASRPREVQEQPASPTASPGFTYNPEGRRDPFVSLLRRDARAPSPTVSARPAGLAGLEVGDVTLRGTVQTHDGFVAILQDADQKTYIVRVGDTLFDGTVRTISQNDIVILQQSDDPRPLDTEREVRKVLRQTKAD